MTPTVAGLIAVIFYLAAAIPQGLVLIGRGEINPAGARIVSHRARFFLFGIIAVSAHGISAFATI